MAVIVKSATDKGKQVIVNVHRSEILDQIKATFEKNQVNMSLVEFYTVQTLVRRLPNIPPPDIYLVDEAHRIKGKSYMKIIEHFKSSYKLFFTGTPVRLNGEGFDDVATDLVVGKSVKWLQENGNIAPFKYFGMNLLPQDKLKKKMGEFTNRSITEVFEEIDIYGDVVENYKRIADNQQAIVYAHSVAVAEEVAREFNENGYPAMAVSAKTPTKEREQGLQDFRDKKLKIMVNVQLYTEGIDLPGVDVCIMLRPTASLALYLQFAMRPLNPREGKTAILIDHVGNASRHGLPNQDREWSLKGHKRDILPITECPSCFMVFERSEALKKIAEEDDDNVPKGYQPFKKGEEYTCCPYCESLFPRKHAKKKEKTKVDGELIELTEENLIVLRKTANQCRTIDELEVFRKSKAYKPGWEFHQAREKGLINSRADLAKIAEIRGFKSGWIYHKAKQLGLK